ncbi:MAG TPA: signal peptidase I [Spirochaetota bacterium]|nr:signal peptidase I [Spirochaetota bacterium]HSA15241.1 signal peptidase I [Spirochaetota bacterium]
MYTYEEKPDPKLRILKAVIFLSAGIIAGMIAARIFVLPYNASDDSMKPNISPGDRAIICRFKDPSPGDIVLVKSPVEPDRALLKRIMAAEGDTVEVRNKIIYVNDSVYRFKWKTNSSDTRVFPMHFTGRDTMPAVKLERRQFFLLNDNLDNSFDSRNFGPVDDEAVIGVMIYKM